MPPWLPKDLGNLDQPQQDREMELYRCRLVHYHYVENTEKCNKPHYAAMTHSMATIRRRLFGHASDPWEGETLELKIALIEATETWEMLRRGGSPCPVVFDAKDVLKTKELDAKQRGADETLEGCQNMLGVGLDGWMPSERYEEVMAGSKLFKERVLAEVTSEELAQITAHWPFDDMDESKYQRYY